MLALVMFKNVLPLLKKVILSMIIMSRSFVVSESKSVDAPSAIFFAEMILNEFLISLLTLIAI